jgi:hypothetical protein
MASSIPSERLYAGGDWIPGEFSEPDLGDARGERRLRRLAALPREQPAASLPQACGAQRAIGAALTRAAPNFRLPK